MDYRNSSQNTGYHGHGNSGYNEETKSNQYLNWPSQQQQHQFSDISQNDQDLFSQTPNQGIFYGQEISVHENFPIITGGPNSMGTMNQSMDIIPSMNIYQNNVITSTTPRGKTFTNPYPQQQQMHQTPGNDDIRLDINDLYPKKFEISDSALAEQESKRRILDSMNASS